VVVKYGTVDASYQVHVVTRDGGDELIGEIAVADGTGQWGIAIDVDIPQLAEIRLASETAPTLTADFRGFVPPPDPRTSPGR
jgi:hypothetical protein